MIILRKYFSKSKSKKDNLKFFDNLNIQSIKHTPKALNNIAKEDLDNRTGKGDIKKSIKLGLMEGMSMGAPVGLVNGLMAEKFAHESTFLPHKRARGKFAVVGAATGAIAGGLGAGLGAAMSTKYAKNHPNSKLAKLYKKERDQFRVADGEMSKDDFIKKYYK